MKIKFSLKQIVCFLLAVAMLLATVGCKEETTKKKKKIIKKKVIVVQDDENTSSSDDGANNNNSGDDFEYPDYDSSTTTTVRRTIPKLNLGTEEYVEVFLPEFESKNVDWAGPADYTIVYDADTTVNRVLANKLATFFKDSDNVILEVKPDTDPSIVNDGKLILVGDTLYKSSTLKSTEFAVTKLSNGNIFFEGGHTTMVEKAVDWFRTVERVSGKVATLSGTQDDFVASVNLFGDDYVYVWGDEFDGEELYDDSKWTQVVRTEYSDLKIVHNDPHFQYVEGGRLRLTVDRYFDPSDGNVGWGAHGSCNSKNDMIFQNGYLEMKVRFDFDQGSFPALWLMTSESPLEKYVPNYEQYKDRYFNLETDIFEFFGTGTHASANMHKWYKGDSVQILDENGEPTGRYKITGVNGVDLTDSIKNPDWTSWGKGTFCAFVWEWPENKNTFDFSEKETETLYKDYHLYQMLYTPESVKFGIDNNWYCEWPLDVAFDYIEGTDPTNNNNGIGYNFWHYLYLDQYVYPPSRMEEKGADAVVTSDDVPLNTYVDYVRLYQLPDEIAVITSAEVE